MSSYAGTDITVISLAFNRVQPEIANNIFEKIPTLNWLKASGRVKMYNGGERLSFPLMHATNTTAGSYSAYGVLDTTPQEGIGSAEYVWRQYGVSVSISGRERRQVSGSAAIVDILEAKKSQAEMSIANTINGHLFATQSGNNIDSIFDYVAETPTSGTIGGLSRSANTWWRNQTVSGASSSTAFDNLLARFRTIYNQCTAAAKGFGSPELYACARAVYEGYESRVDSQRHYGNEKLLNLGFDNLAFKGAGVMFDNDIASDDCYVLNSQSLWLAMHPDAQFSTTDFVKPANQDAIVAQILFQGNLVMVNAATLGRIFNIS